MNGLARYFSSEGSGLLHLSLAGRPQLLQLLLLFRRQHLH
jgi:hypothetical protein